MERTNTLYRTLIFIASFSLVAACGGGGGSSSGGSGAGGSRFVIDSPSTASVKENSSGVIYTFTVANRGNRALVFRYTGVGDQDLFLLDDQSGDLSFLSPPDFENPRDSNGDNVYEINVEASGDQGPSAPINLKITVTDDLQLAIDTIFPPSSSNLGGSYTDLTVSGRLFDTESNRLIKTSGTLTVNSVNATFDDQGYWDVTVPVTTGPQTLAIQFTGDDGFSAGINREIDNSTHTPAGDLEPGGLLFDEDAQNLYYTNASETNPGMTRINTLNNETYVFTSPFVFPERLAFSPDKKVIYYLEFGDENDTPRIYFVDEAQPGERIGGRYPFPPEEDGRTVDMIDFVPIASDTQIFYTIDSVGSRILRFHVGPSTETSGPNVGSGPAFLDPIRLVYDQTSTLYVVDSALEQIIAVNVNTGDRTAVYNGMVFGIQHIGDTLYFLELIGGSLQLAQLTIPSGNTKVLSATDQGLGPEFNPTSVLAINNNRQIGYAGDSVRKAIYAINLRNGDRVIYRSTD